MRNKLPIFLIITILITVGVFVLLKIKQSDNKKTITPPVTVSDNTKVCQEGVKDNNCIKCSCKNDSDCKLVTNPYVISECAGQIAVNKRTSSGCIDNVRKNAINATCVVPDDYNPSYNAICVEGSCALVIK